MAYKMIKTTVRKDKYPADSMEHAVLSFIRERCEDLRFDLENGEQLTGRSLKENQIPFNMEKDIDRLCLENAVARFLHSGKKEDAFDIYFCYLDMFVGDYDKTRRMIELLSEFEENGSRLLMKHRDHYVHSVYVFLLGLAIYEANEAFRKVYNAFYHLEEKEAGAHYLQYWGLASLFHDIGYPFELPFEQVASYFEVSGEERKTRPFIAYQMMKKFTELEEKIEVGGRSFHSTDEMFAYLLEEKLGKVYAFTKESMYETLNTRAAYPEKYNYFMDHAYFSATVLFRKLFVEMKCERKQEHLDALTAILLHNSLYKFDVTNIRSEANIPLKMELHPLAYMLMLCDELQCWDRTAYGRNSITELHPFACSFQLKENSIKATYHFDKKEGHKIRHFEKQYDAWLAESQGKCPELKAYSKMYIRNDKGIIKFLEDIEKIIDLSEMGLSIDVSIEENVRRGKKTYFSESNFINLYNFAMILNERWSTDEWKKAKAAGTVDAFVTNQAVTKACVESFKKLSLEYKLSNINQAKAFAEYMNEIGCFYTDKDVDYEFLEGFTEEEAVKIGILEHRRWLQEHYDMGWAYGEPEKQERELVRLHKDMIPGVDAEGVIVSREDARQNYYRLDKEEQDKDIEPMECMLAMLKVFDGVRIYRL